MRIAILLPGAGLSRPVSSIVLSTLLLACALGGSARASILQSTYLGGAADDQAQSMAIHPTTGEIYVAGSTLSNPFPGTTGGAVTAPGTAFVSRFSSALNTLQQSSFVAGAIGANGGSGGSSIGTASIAIHPVSGDVYVTANGTISRFNANLTQLLGSMTIATTVIRGLAIHPTTGNVYVTGNTTNATLPSVAGGAQSVQAGNNDAFVMRLTADLATVLQSTYLGDDADDTAYAIAIHPSSGDVYVTGSTSAGNVVPFPGLGGGASATPGGGTEGFVSRFSADLLQLKQSTLLGTSGTDIALALAIHPSSGAVYVTGRTTSTLPFAPNPAGGAQASPAGGIEAFLLQLSADLKTAMAFTYLGGAGAEAGAALAIHPTSGEVYVGGTTGSSPFPVTSGGAQASFGGVNDAFVTRLSADLSVISQSTYLGAAGTEVGLSIAFHPTSGNLYVAGSTASTGVTFPAVSGGAQPAYAGASASFGDAFVSVMNPDLKLVTQTPNAFSFVGQYNVPVSTVRTAGPVQITGLTQSVQAYVDGQPGSTMCVSTANNCTDCDVSAGFAAASLVSNNNYVCVRHTSSSVANDVTSTALHIGTVSSKFWVSTGPVFAGVATCVIDVDGNGSIDALTDGLMLMRAMFGLTGTSVTNNAVGTNATRTTWTTIRAFLNGQCGANFQP